MLLEPFLQQTRQFPQRTALTAGEQSLSYGELLRRAEAIAAQLQALGIQAQQPVAIFLERGIDAVCAVFGVLLAGACYLPLDIKNPGPRLQFIVQNAKPRVVLGLGEPPPWLESGHWLDISGCPEVTPQKFEHFPQSLAAILYTSGSTGSPRGVALSHGAIAAFAQWAANLIDLSPADRIASSTPFFFDLSTFDLFAVLGRGASLHFLPAQLTLAPAKLSAWLQEHVISGWYTVPSLLVFLAYKGNLAQTALPDLRFVFFAGEVFPTPALIDLIGHWPTVRLFNFFGPTETNVCCYWPVDPAALQPTQAIPIGQPAASCELQVAPETGELWVRGPTLASGYWSDGELKPLTQNPQAWYATGDRVSLEEGQFQFHGRLGRMLKCAGYRVEPAEIETQVHALPGVKNCAVIGLPDPASGQRPALALVLELGMTVAQVRSHLAKQLPSYMQPSRYLSLDSLPLLPNGKLDYRQLQTLFESPP